MVDWKGEKKASLKATGGGPVVLLAIREGRTYSCLEVWDEFRGLVTPLETILEFQTQFLAQGLGNGKAHFLASLRLGQLV